METCYWLGVQEHPTYFFGVSSMHVCPRVVCNGADCVSTRTHRFLMLADFVRWQPALYFEDRWGFTQCVGAIDGSHKPIITPPQYHMDYLNRKGWHSMILQGVVDGKGLFWNAFPSQPGSLQDAHVLRLSTLWELASHGSLFTSHTKNISSVNAGTISLVIQHTIAGLASETIHRH